MSKTRFLIPEERRFPYRDLTGRVNINLVNASLAALDAEPLHDDKADNKLRKRMTAWQWAARKALAARPADERLTFDELVGPSIAEVASHPKQTPTKLSAPTPARQAPRLPSRTPVHSHTLAPSAGLSTMSSSNAATPSHANSGPKTVAMRRRLFRKPKAGDEPLFHDVEVFSEVLPLEADLHYLGQIADARARARPKVKKSKNADETPVSPVAAKRSRRLTIDSDNEEEVEESDEAPRRQERDERTRGARGARGASPTPSVRSGSSEASSCGGSGSSAADDSSDVYEVEALLDEVAGRGFLIRWAGYGPEDDTWEPEEHVAPEMVAAFRYERSLARSNRGDDYMLGRTRLLWCAPCASHHPADNFSSRQRGAAAACRSCLSHHYKVQARGHVSMLTGASHETPVRTPEAEAAWCRSAERDLSGDRKQRGRKRARCADESDGESDSDADADVDVGVPKASIPPRGLSTPGTPWAPQRAQRPVARALSHRQAALEVSTSRLFGFGSL